MLLHTKRQVFKVQYMFYNAKLVHYLHFRRVRFTFLLKLKWLKNKNIYEGASNLFNKKGKNPTSQNYCNTTIECGLNVEHRSKQNKFTYEQYGIDKYLKCIIYCTVGRYKIK